MNALHHVGLLEELSAQFQRLASQPREAGATPPAFGSLAHELLYPVRLEALTAELLLKRLRATAPSDAAAVTDELLELFETGKSQRWRCVGESFRRAHLPGLASLCVQLEKSWKGRPQLRPGEEESWWQTAAGFARWLYDYIVGLARARNSA